MPVEFLKHSGEPEDQVLLKTRDLVFRKEAALRKKENPEFEALLAKVDFVWIKSAFREILINSSVDPERLNFVDPELVILSTIMKKRKKLRFNPDTLGTRLLLRVGKKLSTVATHLSYLMKE